MHPKVGVTRSVIIVPYSRHVIRVFESALAKELKGLGADRVSPMHRGVGLFGDREILWRANLELPLR